MTAPVAALLGVLATCQQLPTTLEWDTRGLRSMTMTTNCQTTITKTWTYTDAGHALICIAMDLGRSGGGVATDCVTR